MKPQYFSAPIPQATSLLLELLTGIEAQISNLPSSRRLHLVLTDDGHAESISGSLQQWIAERNLSNKVQLFHQRGAACLLKASIAEAPEISTGRRYCYYQHSWNHRIFLLALSIVLFFAHGYHPYSQDASIYVAAIQKAASPSLYQSDALFLEPHLRHSIFSTVLGYGLHIPGVTVDLLLLLSYFATVFFYLAACFELSKELFEVPAAQYGATLFAAACFTIPVAATSLLLMDPYITARSFSTPASIFAIAAGVSQKWWRSLLWTGVALAFHPLMGAYLVLFLLSFFVIQASRSAAILLSVIGILAAGVITHIRSNIQLSPAYLEAVNSRNYYFLSRWEWYEIAGLVLPLLLFALYGWSGERQTAAKLLSQTCAILGLAALILSCCFVHASQPNYLMMLQPLRTFHILYGTGLLLLGGSIVHFFLHRGAWMGLALPIIVMAGVSAADKASYAKAPHIELATQSYSNPHCEALLWIRDHTPENAVFAQDTELPFQEDSNLPGFRAFTRRSILTDAKDEGLASLIPSLAAIWHERWTAQLHLSQLNDQSKIQKIQPFGATWLLLPPTVSTQLSCPFHNAATRVCKVH